MTFKDLEAAVHRIQAGGFQLGHHIMARRIGLTPTPTGYQTYQSSNAYVMSKAPTHVVKLADNDPVSIDGSTYILGTVIKVGPVYPNIKDLKAAHPELSIPDSIQDINVWAQPAPSQ